MNTMTKILFVSAGAAAALVACNTPLFYAEIEEPKLCKTIDGMDPTTPPFAPTDPGQDLRMQFPVPLGQMMTLFAIGGADGGSDGGTGGDADGGFPMPNFNDITTNIKLIEFDLNAREGILDFNSVETAQISVEPFQSSTLPPAVLLTYQKDPANLPGRTLVVAGDKGVDLAKYLAEASIATLPDGGSADGNVLIEAVMTGSLPQNPWRADMKACIYMKARLNYLTAYGL